jgi:hypothetical protein
MSPVAFLVVALSTGVCHGVKERMAGILKKAQLLSSMKEGSK